MKIYKLTLATFAIFLTQTTFAQSNVSIYGVIDTMIRHTNNEINADGTLGEKTKMEEGVFNGPRIGFKGMEDLGDGTTALIQLEMGFSSADGTSDQQGQLFGRQAFVGLKNSKWGEIDLGRQYGVAFDTIGKYDPMGVGNVPENAWQMSLVGARFDNTLKYSKSWGPLSAELQYSFGGQSGSSTQGTTVGAALNYADGPYGMGAFVQQSTDQFSNQLLATGLGTTLNVQSTTLFMNAFNARRDAGFTPTASNSGGALANTSLLNNTGNDLARTDNVLTVGALYRATPALSYTVGYTKDWAKNESSTGNSGQASTIYAVADYSLSKRTDIYLNLDYTKVAGGEIDNGDATNTLMQFYGAGLGGATNRTGIAIGFRTRF